MLSIYVQYSKSEHDWKILDDRYGRVFAYEQDGRGVIDLFPLTASSSEEDLVAECRKKVAAFYEKLHLESEQRKQLCHDLHCSMQGNKLVRFVSEYGCGDGLRDGNNDSVVGETSKSLWEEAFAWCKEHNVSPHNLFPCAI